MPSDPLQLEYASTTTRGALILPTPERGPFVQLLIAILMTLVWSVIAIFVIGLLTFAIAGIAGTAVSMGALIVSIVLIPMAASARRMIRRRRGLAVLGYVRQAVRLNLPMHRVLMGAAASETGILRVRLQQLVQSLDSGAPISASVAATVPEVGPRALGLILIGEQTGRLGSALDRVLGDATRKSRESTTPSDAIVYWYVPAALTLASGVISMILIYVVPKFNQILHDFKAPVPPVFEALESVGQWIFALVPILAFSVLFAVAGRLQEVMTGRPPSRIFRKIGERLVWWIPIAHGMVRDVALADICLAIADAVDQGFPLDQVLGRVSQLEVNGAIRTRIDRWAFHLSTGESPAAAAKAAGMPGLLVGLLATAQANPADVFRFAGRFYQTRSLHRREILRSLYLPVCTALTGLIVLFVALSIFEPIQTLLQVSGPQWFLPCIIP